VLDYTLGILHDPFENTHMGITAENVAARYGITREMQDELAFQSQQRAARAIAEGRFKDQIVPVESKTRKGVVVFDTDEHVRADTTLQALSTLKPAFKKDGVVTAGNASGINDGAAALVLASAEGVRSLGRPPVARIVAYAHAGAAQACAVVRELDLDPNKVNPNGSGISLGHPVGATGAIISTKAIHELHRTGGRYALVTMCIGGGQGIAAIFERV
jgi:acetyl-CoA C-acetyltransferase